MAYSDDQIRNYALQLEAKGASAEEIESFVASAVAERERAVPAAPEPAAAPQADMGQPQTPGQAFAQGMLGNPYGLQPQNQQASAPLARYGLPLLGTPLGPAGTAPLSGAGEALAQMIEGGKVNDPGAVAKATALGAVPGRGLMGAFKGGGALAQGAKTAATFAGAEALGETARRTINERRPTTYDDLGEAARALLAPSAIGFGAGALAGVAGRLQAARALRDERLPVFQAAGVEKPTLDLIFPSQAALANRVAAANPTFAKLRVDATRPLLEQFEAVAAQAPAHEEIYKQLRPYVGMLDRARAEVDDLAKTAATLRERALAAQKSAQVAPQELAQLEAAASASELNAINAKARMLHEANANLGGFLDYDTTAQQFRGVVDQLFATRKQIGAAKFAAANIDQTAPIFDKAWLRAAARDALAGRYKGTDIEKRILGAIDDAGGEGSAALNLGQFREMRQAISDRFVDVDPRQLGAYEAAARQAYGGLTEASRRMISALPGANPAAYDDAVAYWRATAEAASSRYARPLLAREASEATFASLANDIASGKMAEVRSFNEFVDAVAQDSPEVAKLARQQLTQAIRNSFLGQARSGFGVDTKKLTDSLARASGNFDISTLGFGAPGDIKRWQATFQEFGLKNVGEADLNAIFGSPEVQRAAGLGSSIAEAMRPAAARLAYLRNVQQQVLRGKAGLKADAAAAAAEANRLAEQAGMTLEQRRQVLQGIENDPIAKAFSGGQTYGVPTRPGGGGGGMNAVTETIFNLGPKEGPTLINALRTKNAVLAEQVQRRMLADSFQFFRPANSPGHVWALDKAKVQRFFHPAAGSTEAQNATTLKAIVGTQAFSRYESLLRAVEMVSDVEKSGGVLSTDGAKTIYTGSGLARQIGSVASAQLPVIDGFVRGLRGLWDARKFAVLSAIATNDAYAKAVLEHGGDAAAAMTSLGPQVSLRLMASDRDLKRELAETE